MKATTTIYMFGAVLGLFSSLVGAQEGSCITACNDIKPTCPYGQSPSGFEGCWGCCQPTNNNPTDPDPEPGISCLTACSTTKPTCPPGESASGMEGCWGCCQPGAPPTDTDTDIDTCLSDKPDCPAGQIPSGTPECWGRCQDDDSEPEPPTVFCITACMPDEPICPLGEAATGSEGCWGCCQRIKAASVRASVDEL